MNSIYVKRVTAMFLLAGALTLAACGGGSSDSESDSEATSAESSQAPVGGMFASLSDEDIQCLEDEGVTLPEMPEGAPEGGAPPEGMPPGAEGAQPPEGMPEGTTPPEGMPEGGPPEGMPEGAPEGMDGMQEAIEACGIEMPTPPSGDDSSESDGSS